MDFEWDPDKNVENIEKHGVDFNEAKLAWLDPNAVSTEDKKHSKDEVRRFKYGKVHGNVLTVRYTIRQAKDGELLIWIIGAGYWRDGRDVYEQRNSWRR